MRAEVCSIGELPPGATRAATIGDRQVAVFNVDGEVFALDNACRHAEGPLGEGVLDGPVVTCPWHWWRYDVRTGLRLGSESIFQPTYPTSVADGVVYVEVPEPAPVKSMREQLLEHAREWRRDE